MSPARGYHVAYADRPGQFVDDVDVAIRLARESGAQFVQERGGEGRLVWRPADPADPRVVAVGAERAALDRIADALGLGAAPDERTPDLVVAYSAKRDGTLAAAMGTVRRRAEWLRQALDAPEGTAHPQLLAEVAGLRGEPAYDETGRGPIWVGDDWTVTALLDGEIEVSVADDSHPGGAGPAYLFERDVVAAIVAAHARAPRPSTATTTEETR